MNRQQRRSLKSRQKGKGAGRSDGSSAQALDSVDVAMKGAVALHRAGQLDEALVQYDEVLRLYPKHVDALSNSAAIAVQSGDFESAVQRARGAVALDSANVGALNNLGMILEAMGILDDAEAVLGQALELDSTIPNIYVNLGNVRQKLGRFEDAAALYRKALALAPDNAVTHNNLGNTLRTLGDAKGSLASLRKAIDIEPGFVEAFNNLGILYQQCGKYDEVDEAFHRALALRPEFIPAHINLGNALRRQGRFDDSLAAFRGAIAIQPDHVLVHNEMAMVYHDMGRTDDAIATLRRTLELKPEFSEAHSNLLFLQSYHSHLTPEESLREHRRWEALHAPPERIEVEPHRNARTADRRLRIGYVSPDFRDHVVSFFVEPLLEHHDRDAVEVFGYAEVANPDAITARLSARADHWRSIVGLSDDRVAEMVRDDRIDVLVDLAGHTAGNRLKMFARKPAPVQATYLGYFATTGLSAMDYWINDGVVHPEMTDGKTAEEIYRLPRCWVCYQPRDDVPGVASPPSTKAGASGVTFGSFNNLNKVSPGTIAMWAGVLRAVPNSRLLIKSRPLDNRLVEDRLRAAFADRGIEADRLLLYGSIAGSGNHMAMYNRVDVGLDTFPFTGGATSLDAFWMGVPVITLVGETHAERMSASLITALGRPEWIADTEEAFIAKAVALAADEDLRVGLRAVQRQRMAESTLCDGAGLARAMEDAYRDMWRRYLDGDELIAATTP